MLFDLCSAQLNKTASMQLAIQRPSTLHQVQSEQQFTFDRSMNPGIPVPRHEPGINTIPRRKSPSGREDLLALRLLEIAVRGAASRSNGMKCFHHDT